MNATPWVVEGGWTEVHDPGEAYVLTHSLEPVFHELAAFRRRRSLERSDVFHRHEAEIERVLHGFEWHRGRSSSVMVEGPVQAVAWNVERGKRFGSLVHALEDDPRLRHAGLLLLTEVDIGMGRSGNRNVPRALAERLGCDYVYANFHLVLTPGDLGEREHREPNTLAMHGAALLSRYPIRRFGALSIPEYKDKYEVLEKRLGTKRVLFVEVELAGGPLTVVVVHLDPFCGPAHRARQGRAIADALRRFGGAKVLLGGDLNTHTYDLSSRPRLAFDVLRKLARYGFAGTVRQYMHPDRVFERRLFEALRAEGLQFEGFSDAQRGTLSYDLNDPEVVGKSLDEVPKSVIRWLERRLEPWGGCVPMRFDWFAGRGLHPLHAQTVPKPRFRGEHVSDHDPLILTFEASASDMQVASPRPRASQ